jgi:hypothetical protein
LGLVSLSSVYSVWRFLNVAIIAAALCFPTIVHSSPWIEPGDLRLRHSLQQLSDSRALHAPLTTWPVMWSAVAEGLAQGSLPVPANSLALAYVQFERSHQAPLGLRADFELSAAKSVSALRGFAEQSRGELQAGFELDWVGRRLAVGFAYSAVDDPADGKKERLDGSYIAANAGNWVLGAGAIDRWWGPGWQSSLILSTNARPIPSVWLNRKTPEAPEWGWLRWVGPWQLTLLVGQLEEERFIPDAKLLGARLTSMPFPGLELGVVRAIQWGGKGQAQDARSLGKALIGDSNEVGGDAGNELAGFDFRYGFAAGGVSYGAYGQVIGEDEAGNSPSKYMGLVGFDLASGWWSGSQRWFLEGVNTAAGVFQSGADFNVAFEHSQYRSGFNYRGRNIANTYSSDSSANTLGLMHFFDNGHNLVVTLTDATLSRDGNSVAINQQPNPPVRPQIPVMRQPLFHSLVRYERPVFQGWLTLQTEYTDQPIVLPGSEIPSKWQFMASWRYRF